MAEVVHGLLDYNLKIKLKVECEALDAKNKLIQSEIRKTSESISVGSALELKLNIDELQELYSMCTRPVVRSYIQQIITQFDSMYRNISKSAEYTLNEKRKWSDIVAGRHPKHLEFNKSNKTAIYNIETVITAKPTYHINVRNEIEQKRVNLPQTAGKNSKKYCDGRPRMVIVGDSHARGVAGELLHQSDHRFNTTGFVKPNAGLMELLHSAKKDLRTLTSKDTLIIVGGSNDIDKRDLDKNITSIVNYLEDIQNTNVIVILVPVRYDIEAKSQINERIENYNKELDKITKRFRHVQLIKVTTNRGHFTRHGLHLNYKGKEVLSKEILMNLHNKRKRNKEAEVQLPVENGSKKDDDQIIKDVNLNEIVNVNTSADISKGISRSPDKSGTETKTDKEITLVKIPISEELIGANQEPCTEISRISKVQRNRPKLKDDNFLWI